MSKTPSPSSELTYIHKALDTIVAERRDPDSVTLAGLLDAREALAKHATHSHLEVGNWVVIMLSTLYWHGRVIYNNAKEIRLVDACVVFEVGEYSSGMTEEPRFRTAEFIGSPTREMTIMYEAILSVVPSGPAAR
jgi:hypothetical protein